MSKKRVIVWGTGPIGIPGLRGLIGHPEYELVGLHAWSPDKVGRDAGDIAGLGNTGIIATNDVAALLALKADCLVYQSNYAHREAACVAEVVPFLEAGTHVVGPSMMDLVVPARGRPQLVKPIADACEKGRSAIFCGGTDPGYMTIGHLFSLLSCAGRVDSVHVAEICNLNGYGSYNSLEQWGFNLPMDARIPMFHDEVGRGWHESTVWGIGDYLGVELDRIEQTLETRSLPFDYDAAWGQGKANTIAAVRWTMTGYYKDEPLVVYRKVERTHRDAGADFEQPLHGTEAGYQVTVKGDPGFHTEMSIGLYAGCAATALHPINAIAAVCAAKPGIIGQLDLPHFYTKRIRR
jgi:4-hydroxy-tetrahydrodipicolinate reductase